MAMDSADPDPWRHLADLQQVAEQVLPHAPSTVALLAALLDRLTQAGACVGGLVWNAEPGGREPLVRRFRNRSRDGQPDGVHDESRAGSLNAYDWSALLAPLAAIALVGPQSVTLSAGSAAYWLVCVPLQTGDRPRLWLALVFEQLRLPDRGEQPGVPPSGGALAQGVSVGGRGATEAAGPVPGGWIDFTLAVGELATLYSVRWQRDRLVEQQSAARLVDARVESLYAALSASRSPTDFLAAVQTAFGADRAWLLEVVHETPRLRASSLPRVDPHADRQLVLLKELAGLVAAGREPLRGEAGSGLTGATVSKPSDLRADEADARLIEYLDVSRNRRVELIPLTAEESQPPAVLVLDYFTGAAASFSTESSSTASSSTESFPTESFPTASSAPGISAPGISSATTFSATTFSAEPSRAGNLSTEARERLLRHVSRGWSWLRERGAGGWLNRLSRGLGLRGEPGRWRLAVAGVLAGGLLLACPWRFEITAEAELEPTEQRRVFAPDEGVVQRVVARDGDEVEAGAVLLELDSTSLQARRTELETTLQTQRVRLQAQQTARGRRGGNREELSGTAAGELEETRRSIAGLEAQLAVLQGELDRLTVRSPIAGRVDQFDIEQRLLRRPVARGQELLRVAQQAGPWRLRVRIPESESGYVAGALRQRGPLAVRYQFVTDPGQSRRGELTAVADRAETDRQGRLWLRGEVAVAPADHAGQRAGGGAVVRIDCGWRTLGFVLFRELGELLARWWW
jgi:multidrug efflux pump subunit AcrA (membrane-fusion protein)